MAYWRVPMAYPPHQYDTSTPPSRYGSHETRGRSRGRDDGVASMASMRRFTPEPTTGTRRWRRDAAASTASRRPQGHLHTIEAATQSRDDAIAAMAKGQRTPESTMIGIMLDVQTDHGVQEA